MMYGECWTFTVDVGKRMKGKEKVAIEVAFIYLIH